MSQGDPLAGYRKAKDPVPASMKVWPLYGAGLENLGVNDAPVDWPVPAYGPDELLARVDAVGMCFSDVKILRLGPEHPRLQGRDMRNDPVVMGHEVALTIVGVGDHLKDRYEPGARFIVQADIWHNGRNVAYGYKIQGGLAPYGVITPEILQGDDGCYLIPVKSETGYAQAALAEPWACVIASYQLSYRDRPKPGGTTLIVCGPGGTVPILSVGFSVEEHPKRVVVAAPDPEAAETLCAAAARCGAAVEAVDLPAGADWAEALSDGSGGAGFDDVIASSDLPPAILSSLGAGLSKDGGMICVYGPSPVSGAVDMDIGRVHYDRIVWVGARDADIAGAYGTKIRSELLADGVAWFLGAGGPMGRMHVQRAIELGDGPSTIVATDVSDHRLDDLEASYGPEAKAAGKILECFNPTAGNAEAFQALANRLTNRRGFDDIVVLAPIASVTGDAVRFLGKGGVLNLFAGVARGTTASIDLAPIVDERQARVIGSTASTIDDLRLMLAKTESGELSTNRSVAAIGGLAQAKEGIQALMDNRYPGKVVIFPQIADLPLTALPDLRERFPSVHARLERGRVWTREAEEELLRLCLGKENCTR